METATTMAAGVSPDSLHIPQKSQSSQTLMQSASKAETSYVRLSLDRGISWEATATCHKMPQV